MTTETSGYPNREPLRLSVGLLDQLEALADELDVSLSHLVESLMWQWILSQPQMLGWQTLPETFADALTVEGEE